MLRGCGVQRLVVRHRASLDSPGATYLFILGNSPCNNKPGAPLKRLDRPHIFRFSVAYLCKPLPSHNTKMTDMNGGNFRHHATEPPKSDLVMPLFSLKGKTAIVSGAGAGIGLAVANGFAEAGANVAIWYNNNKKALERAAE